VDHWQDLTEKQPRCQLDPAFYERVRAATAGRRPRERFSIPPHSGRGFAVRRGQAFRVVEEAGAQAGAVAVWNADDHRETLLAATTIAREGVVVRPYVRLMSGLPWVRPLMTCVDDTVRLDPPDPEWHQHSVGSHCSPEYLELRFGVTGANACRVNLLQAIEPFGLAEEALHDTVNVHYKVHFGDVERGRIYAQRSDAKPGDHVEFYAELDLLVAVSVCPLGDGSGGPAGPNGLRPLGIEIYDTGIPPREFPRWTDGRANWTGRWIPPAGWTQ